MAQIFHRSTDTLSKVSIFGAAFLAGGGLWLVLVINRSPYVTGAREARPQPVPFSHAHHVGGIGIACRYCHTGVERSSFAGIPPTQTCMNCHSRIWSGSPTLEPVRASLRTGDPIEWNRVHDLPGFVYFDHSAHVNRGVGCTTCHGPIGAMPLVRQEASLQMEWCLDCHRQPEMYLRPQDRVYDVDYRPPTDQLALGRRLVREYGIHTRTDCSTCHR